MPVLDSGARGSTTTFVERGIGDVLLSWENEAFLAVKELGPDKFEIVVPSLSASSPSRRSRVVDKVVDKKGTRAVAEAYLEFLYTPKAQEIAAKHFYRPARRRRSRRSTRRSFPKVKLFTIDEVFGGWQQGAEGALRRRRHRSTRSTRRRSKPCASAFRQRTRAARLRALTLGFTLLYLSLIVLIPLSAAVPQDRSR